MSKGNLGRCRAGRLCREAVAVLGVGTINPRWVPGCGHEQLLSGLPQREAPLPVPLAGPQPVPPSTQAGPLGEGGAEDKGSTLRGHP